MTSLKYPFPINLQIQVFLLVIIYNIQKMLSFIACARLDLLADNKWVIHVFLSFCFLFTLHQYYKRTFLVLLFQYYAE